MTLGATVNAQIQRDPGAYSRAALPATLPATLPAPRPPMVTLPYTRSC